MIILHRYMHTDRFGKRRATRHHLSAEDAARTLVAPEAISHTREERQPSTVIGLTGCNPLPGPGSTLIEVMSALASSKRP